MIDTFKTSLKQLFTSRYLTTMAIITLALAIAYLVFILVSVRPSELQVVTHYTAFGVSRFYTDQWWYLLGFGVFGLMTAFFHIALSIKVFVAKGHPLAIMVAWLGIAILLFAWITSFYIINVRSML